MGISSRHASNIGMIRNLSTGYISLQFHVVYDNEFQTVLGGYGDNEALTPHIWESLCKNSVENAANDLTTTDQRIPRFHDDWLTPVERIDRERQDVNSTIQNRVRIEVDKHTRLVPITERNDMILPPAAVDQPLIIDLAESDDEEPRYHVRSNRGGVVDTSIYDVNESMWIDEDLYMLGGGNTTVTDDD